MDRLEHGVLPTDVRARDQAQPSHQARAEIAQDVSVQVGEEQDVEVLRRADEPCRERVDVDVLPGDVRIIARVRACRLEEDPVGVAHHVRLVADRHFPPPVGSDVFEREADDPPGAGDADGLQGDPGVLRDLEAAEIVELPAEGRGVGCTSFEFDPAIEVLRVLADHDEVDVVVPGANAGERTGRPDGCEQVEPLPQGHIEAPEPLAHGGGDRTLDRRPASPDRLQRAFGEQGAVGLERRSARRSLLPSEVDPGGVEHQPGRGGHLRADPVAGDQDHLVRHRG